MFCNLNCLTSRLPFDALKFFAWTIFFRILQKVLFLKITVTKCIYILTGQQTAAQIFKEGSNKAQDMDLFGGLPPLIC